MSAALVITIAKRRH